jgi:MFS_1 like family
MALAEPLHGLSFALLHLACMRLIGRLVPANLAATAQAIYGTVAIGATTAMVTLLSGTLYGRFGVLGHCCALRVRPPVHRRPQPDDEHRKDDSRRVRMLWATRRDRLAPSSQAGAWVIDAGRPL